MVFLITQEEWERDERGKKRKEGGGGEKEVSHFYYIWKKSEFPSNESKIMVGGGGVGKREKGGRQELFKDFKYFITQLESQF